MNSSVDSKSIARLQNRRQEDDFRTAICATLMTPLMSSAHPDFALVRRHVEALRDWYAREAGWPLLDYREGVRLQKRPGNPSDDTRGLPDFDRRRYVLFSLACAVLERSEVQVTLRTLGESILAAAADPLLEARGFIFDLKTHHERKELVAVCRTLLGLGVLTRVAGDEETFVQGATAEADALYDVNRRLLANVLSCARGPSTWPIDEQPITFDDRLRALCVEYVPDSDEGRMSALRFSLARRMLDDPVVYLGDLDAMSLSYFTNQRGPLARRICDATGLSPEQRAEGTALVDPDGLLTDLSMPAEGTDAHVTLLVAEHLCALMKAAKGDEVGLSALSVDRVEAFIADVRDEFGKYWRGSARKAGSERELAKEALERLQKLHLVRIEGVWIVPLPALFRFSLAELDVKSSASKRQSLTADLLSGEFDNG